MGVCRTDHCLADLSGAIKPCYPMSIGPVTDRQLCSLPLSIERQLLAVITVTVIVPHQQSASGVR
jgi:hypothetical protein